MKSTTKQTGELVARVEQNWQQLSECGLFGCDYQETVGMMRRLLGYHNLVLRTRRNYRQYGDNVEVWIEPKAGTTNYPTSYAAQSAMQKG